MTVDTHLYGDVDVTYGESEIAGRYRDSEIPTSARIQRIGQRTRDKTPIGTRTASNLRASIDGRTISVRPGSARVLKRSYRVRIELGERVLVLVAKNLEDSTLLNGDSDRGDNSFGELTRDFEGGIEVAWSLPFTFMKKLVEPPVPSHEDVLVGVVVAAAFGTGGLSASTIVMGAIGSIFPP